LRICVAILLALSSIASAAVDEPHEPALTAAIAKRMAATEAPGLSVAIVRNGSIIFEHGFGRRGLHGPPVDGNTEFEVGSLTKQFTAAAILQLKERGRLSLDDRLAKYIPDFPHADELTLRELLNQTSGLSDFVLTNHFLKISHSLPGSFERIAHMASGPLHFVPGSKWEYSNTNYIALGRVIERASGESYNDYVRRHLFQPAGMSRSTTIAHEPAVSDMAAGYWRGMQMKGPLVPAPRALESWFWSAGDIVSTAGDIARWDIALQSGKIIDSADFALMTEPARLTSGKTDDYAFHWWTDPLRGHRLRSGLGDTYGSSSADDLFPDDHLAIIVLENMAVEPNGSSDAAAKMAAALFAAIEAR
jgi:D-alanyl-D-alanine carboxypeptidase